MIFTKLPKGKVETVTTYDFEDGPVVDSEYRASKVKVTEVVVEETVDGETRTDVRIKGRAVNQDGSIRRERSRLVINYELEQDFLALHQSAVRLAARR